MARYYTGRVIRSLALMKMDNPPTTTSSIRSAVRTLNTAEFVILVLFVIALPLVEAPKNIFWGMFFLLWLWRSFAQRNFGQPSLNWSIVFGGLFAAALISVVASPYPPQWREMGDIIGYVSLGWMLSRTSLNEHQVVRLLWAFV
ncbi:MAG TPA: hypothetical protein VFW00_07380, partial [Rhodocyclaceae bacterium]|nr:hypothetical protein [Rhodocyclaceae bacterium]